MGDHRASELERPDAPRPASRGKRTFRNQTKIASEESRGDNKTQINDSPF